MSVIKEKEETPVQKIAREAGVSQKTVYSWAKKLGYLPTAEEIKAKSTIGRPRKYK